MDGWRGEGGSWGEDGLGGGVGGMGGGGVGGMGEGGRGGGTTCSNVLIASGSYYSFMNFLMAPIEAHRDCIYFIEISMTKSEIVPHVDVIGIVC